MTTFLCALSCLLRRLALASIALAATTLTTHAADADTEQVKSTGTKRALLIAVEPWPDREKDPARGAGWSNLQMMREVLVKKWSFDEANILELYEDAATLENVVRAMETHLVAEAKPGDTVVIYRSSHGTQVADLDGDEPDGLDEVFCTHDFKWSKPETWFIDDIFGLLLDRIDTKDILVITDTCHSAGSTRGDPDAHRALPLGLSSGFVARATPNPDAEPLKVPSHVIHLAACKSDELGYCWPGPGIHPGHGHIFTIQLHSVWMSDSGADLTFHQTSQRVYTKIGAVFKNIVPEPGNPKTWTPQAEGPVTKKIATFLNPPAPSPQPPDSPRPPPPPPLPVWQSQSGDIALTLSTDKQTYAEGELVRVSVAADLDCHLRLFYLSAEHEVYQLFPNQHQPDTAVKKGVTHHFGGEGDAFKLRARPPYGNEILMAVASSRPFTDKESREVRDQLFQEFKNTSLETLGHRGLEVEPGETVLTGRALHLYRVEAKK